jgi:transketolase
MFAADLMAVLLSKYLKYDFNNPQNPNNDHLIFSKGHVSSLLYSIYKAARCHHRWWAREPAQIRQPAGTASCPRGFAPG